MPHLTVRLLSLQQFVIEMSKHYTLAVWTSTMAYNAKKIVNDVFISNNVPLLFTWYNDKCIAETGHGSSTADTGTWKRSEVPQFSNHFDSNSGQRRVYDSGYLPRFSNFCPPPPLDPYPYHKTSNSSSTANHYSEQPSIKTEGIKKSRKVVMIKPLRLVWEAYPEYSNLNTVSTEHHVLSDFFFLALIFLQSALHDDKYG